MKRPLGHAKSYYFIGQDSFDFSHPLRAMAQWVTRHPDAIVLAVGVNVGEEGDVSVTLTVEDVPAPGAAE